MSLDYRQTRFYLSAPAPEQLPADRGAEVAFAGRSNAGKSSALNAITDQKALARVSKTPGRTQQINVFPVGDAILEAPTVDRHDSVDPEFVDRHDSVDPASVDRHDPAYRLIDLPGYGYAKAPPAMRAHWQEALPRYLETRKSLRGLILIMDVRHAMGPLDTQMLDWCAAADLPVHVLLSKADKLSRGAAGNQLQRVRSQALKCCQGASVQLFSSSTRTGVAEARSCLDRWLLEQ